MSSTTHSTTPHTPRRTTPQNTPLQQLPKWVQHRMSIGQRNRWNNNTPTPTDLHEINSLIHQHPPP